MSNAINTERLESLQAELDGKEVYYDAELGYYTVTEKTVSDEELGEEFPTEIIINVLGAEFQNTMDLVRNVEIIPAGDFKDDLIPFSIRQK